MILKKYLEFSMKPKKSAPHQNPRIQEALALHQAGRLAEAAELMKQLLNFFPKNTQLLTHLGTLYLQQGNAEQGVRLLEKSLQITPQQPMALLNLANGMVALKRFEDALVQYERAIAMQPTPEAYFNRGTTLQKLDKPLEALGSFDRALTLKPDFAEAYIHRGLSLQILKRTEEALRNFDRGIALKPGIAEVHFFRGNAFMELKRGEEALACFNQAVSLQPGYAEAYNNRGAVLQDMDRLGDALASYESAIAVQPAKPEAYNNRGTVLRKLKRLKEALAAHNQAIALKPDYAEAHNNRGSVLQELKRFDEALAAHDLAITLNPDYVEAYWNKALLKLLMGDYKDGWRLYEWRVKPRTFTQPLWKGEEPLDEKTLLVHTEQGFGDVIQYCRYAPLLEKRGAKVVFEAPGALIPVLSTLSGSITLVESGKPLPSFDLYCPMMSLPLAFQTTLESIPAEIPYLFASPDKKTAWLQKLGKKSSPRIGLAWSGKALHSNDHNRSIELETLRPLLDLPFEFHSLQKEYRKEDQAKLAKLFLLKDHHLELNDFSDTAALISEMDLIISVDTSVAHLAGAMGKPLWILLPYLPDYRWLLDRADSPWYPMATLFRQPARDDWKAVVSEVVQRIQNKFANTHR
jgi:hypothetical protein